MICIPILTSKTEEAIKFMTKWQDKADLFEVWIDHIHDLDLEKLIGSKTRPLIIVNKPIREQGLYSASEESRIELLVKSAYLGADYIDVGIDTNTLLLKHLIKNKKAAQCIISYHNFNETPDAKELNKILRKATRYKADIVKIATMVKKIEDNLMLFNLSMQVTSQGKKIIAIGMGEMGRISRIVTPLFGSLVSYAPVSIEGRSAPSQLAADDLRRIWKMLSG